MRPSHLTLLASHGLTFLSWLRDGESPSCKVKGSWWVVST